MSPSISSASSFTKLFLSAISWTKIQKSRMDSPSLHEAFSRNDFEMDATLFKKCKSVGGIVQLTHRSARSLVKLQLLWGTLCTGPTLRLSMAPVVVRWNSVNAHFSIFSKGSPLLGLGYFIGCHTRFEISALFIPVGHSTYINWALTCRTHP